MKYCSLLISLLLTACITVVAQDLVVTQTNFGAVLCGVKKCQTVQLKNETAAPITIVAVTVAGPLFSLEDPLFTPPHVVPVGETIGIDFCFTPTAAGSVSENIQITTADSPMPQVVMLTGQVTASRLTISQPTVDFGSIFIGTSKLMSVVVTNQGDAPLTIPDASGLAAPFFLVGGAGNTVQPGQTDTLNFLYVATTEGTQNATAVFAGLQCQTNVMVSLTGTAIKPPAPTVGGVLQITPNEIAFDTAMCGREKCIHVEFRNIGSDLVTIRSVETPPAAPFTGTIPVGAIPVGETREFNLCYQPMEVPKADAQDVVIRADTRQSLSVGVLFDVSGSMSQRISGSESRMQAAREAGVIFIDQLINDPQRNVVDRAQIMSFSNPASSFTIISPFTTNRAGSKQAINNLTPDGATCLYQSVISAVNAIKDEPNPVLVLLSDGADAGCDVTRWLPEVVSAIQSSKVRMFVIGIEPEPRFADTLRSMAAAGSGIATFVRTREELTNAFIEISKQLSQNITVRIPLKGVSVAPLLKIVPETIEFDSVKVGEEKCVNITIVNEGTAPLVFNDAVFAGMGSQFTVRNLPVAALQPGTAGVTFQMCFTPTALRSQQALVELDYNTCRQQIDLKPHGIGYDSVTLVIDNPINVAKIGDTVRVPIILEETVPAHYGIDSLEFTVEYDPTVLNGLGPNPTESYLTKTFVSQVTSDNFFPDVARSTSVFHGGTLVNDVPATLMSVLEFEALRGSATFSDVKLISARFADGNPRVGIKGSSRVNIDTVCFLPQRLIDASARRFDAHILKVVLDRTGSAANVMFTQDHASDVQLAIYDQLGRRVVQTQPGYFEQGEHTITVASNGLRQGVYFVCITTTSGADCMAINFIP